MVTESSLQGSSHAFSVSVVQPRVPLGVTEVLYCPDGACGGPSLVTRALRGPVELFGWGSASSGGQKVGETTMASESGKAVPYATHSANEGHRHRRQPPHHPFGYQ